MYKRLDLTQLEGLDFTQDTLAYMQESYRDSFGAIAWLLGDLVIVTGVLDQGATYSDGWVAINGELMPFTGGVKASRIIVEEVTATENFADGSAKNVYYTKRAKLASSGGNAFSSFVRLHTIKQVMANLAAEVTARQNADTTLQNNINAEATARASADSTLLTNINTRALSSRQIIAGDALDGGGDLSANRTLAVKVDNASIEISSDALSIKNAGVTNSKLAPLSVNRSKCSIDVFVGEKYAINDDLNSFAVGSIQYVNSTAPNAPNTAGGFIVLTVSMQVFTDKVQLAIQLNGTGVGAIYRRSYSLSTWGSWTLINNP